MKGKSFVAGLIVGLLCTATVTAFSLDTMVNAWLRDDINLIVDGDPITLPQGEDMHILEYMGRYYVPARLIAEKLGATVTWMEHRNAIYVKSPEPVRDVIEVEKIVEKEAPQVFNKVPVRLKIDDVTINIFGIQRGSDRTYIYLDVENENGRPIYFDHDNAYIMIDGVQYETIHNNNVMWGWSNSLGPSDEIKEGMMVFENIPEKVYDMKIVIPVVFELYSSSTNETSRTRVFEMSVTFEN